MPTFRSQLNAVDVDAEGLANAAGVFRVETGEGTAEEVCNIINSSVN